MPRVLDLSDRGLFAAWYLACLGLEVSLEDWRRGCAVEVLSNAVLPSNYGRSNCRAVPQGTLDSRSDDADACCTTCRCGVDDNC